MANEGVCHGDLAEQPILAADFEIVKGGKNLPVPSLVAKPPKSSIKFPYIRSSARINIERNWELLGATRCFATTRP